MHDLRLACRLPSLQRPAEPEKPSKRATIDDADVAQAPKQAQEQQLLTWAEEQTEQGSSPSRLKAALASKALPDAAAMPPSLKRMLSFAIDSNAGIDVHEGPQRQLSGIRSNGGDASQPAHDAAAEPWHRSFSAGMATSVDNVEHTHKRAASVESGKDCNALVAHKDGIQSSMPAESGSFAKNEVCTSDLFAPCSCQACTSEFILPAIRTGCDQ